MKNMRNGLMIALLLSVFAVVSCGGSGSASPQSSLNTSASAFGDLVDYYLASCIDFPCNCPGGGTIDADGGDLTLTNCSISGETFTGSFSFGTGDTLSMSFSEFGECSNITGSVTGAQSGTCSGSASGTCGGEFVSCTFSSDCESCNT